MGLVHGVLAVLGQQALEVLGSERHAKEKQQVRVVVDDQDLRSHGGTGPATRTVSLPARPGSIPGRTAPFPRWSARAPDARPRPAPADRSRPVSAPDRASGWEPPPTRIRPTPGDRGRRSQPRRTPAASARTPR